MLISHTCIQKCCFNFPLNLTLMQWAIDPFTFFFHVLTSGLFISVDINRDYSEAFCNRIYART